MSTGQQWAVILIVLWAASIWYSYSMGFMRGETSARKEATKVLEGLGPYNNFGPGDSGRPRS